jgi:signal transduction histidine kinase
MVLDITPNSPRAKALTFPAIFRYPSVKLGYRGAKRRGHIENTTQRMSHVITDLQSLSGIARQEVHRETVNLSELVQSFCTELKSSNPHREIDFVITPDCIVNADAGLVKIHRKPCPQRMEIHFQN